MRKVMIKYHVGEEFNGFVLYWMVRLLAFIMIASMAGVGIFDSPSTLFAAFKQIVVWWHLCIEA